MAELCSPNAGVAYSFLIGKGLRDYQAAAIVGNLQQESAVNPQALGDNGNSHGIAQWNAATTSRWSNLQAFAAELGRNPYDLDAQLEFLWYELETSFSFVLRGILSSSSLEDAVRVFQNGFEACGDCREQDRITFARRALLECPAVRSPIATARGPVFVVAASVLALAAAAGYGAYQAIRKPVF